jgi:hypothetical protein
MNTPDAYVKVPEDAPEIDVPDFASMVWLAFGFLLIWGAIEYALRDER